MKELIEKELAKFRDTNGSYDGIDDDSYAKLEKMIFEEYEHEGFIIALHHFLKLNDKIGLEVDWQRDKWWNDVSDFAAKHIDETIEFVKNECSANEFSTLSEIFDDITNKSKSREFIQAIREAAKRFPEECEKYTIMDSIDFAEQYL